MVDIELPLLPLLLHLRTKFRNILSLTAERSAESKGAKAVEGGGCGMGGNGGAVEGGRGTADSRGTDTYGATRHGSSGVPPPLTSRPVLGVASVGCEASDCKFSDCNISAMSRILYILLAFMNRELYMARYEVSKAKREGGTHAHCKSQPLRSPSVLSKWMFSTRMSYFHI
ncbi:unnamed protein product [Arctia plantaginis]|uniref:Uncharacterized protein n=1 Tax=Arctia plantaginis TaxID=874455 RepID=A0A8S1BBZ2_ARCPL|nr:unnamed protein product [Arctia plantaginis]